jgi:hypothetical protein
MIRHGFLAALLLFPLAARADAQAWRFQFQKGEALTTKVEHGTLVSETVAGRKTDITSKLLIVKRWKVVDIDAQGTATLEQTLLSMRNEQTRPGADMKPETLLFDSNNLAQSTPELKGMMKFINVPVASIRVDGLGRVVEVISGPKDRYDAEPPFAMMLPGQPAQIGQAWVRPFTITLDPPLGVGEKYQAEQRVRLAKIEGGKAFVDLATTIKNPPETAAEKVPLIQKEMQGQLLFDIGRGRVDAVRLAVDKTIENHQGQNSSYRFASTFSEQLVLSSTTIVPASAP